MDKNIKTIENLAKFWHLPVTKEEVRQTISEHPKYPGLASIVDALKTWAIENIVVKISYEQFMTFPLPALVEFRSESRLVLVTGRYENFVEILDPTKASKERLNNNEFRKFWTGVAIGLIKGTYSGHSTTSISQRERKYTSWLHKIIILTWVAVFMCCAGCQLLSFPDVQSIHFLLLFVGLVLSYLIMQQSRSSFAGGYCLSGANECQSVLLSPQSHLFGIIPLADMTTFYFMTKFILSSLLILSIDEAFKALIGWILLNSAFLTLPLLIYSLVVQFMVIRTACILCLTVVLVILVECVMAILINSQVPTTMDIKVASTIVIATALSLLAVYYHKLFFNLKQDIKENRKQLLFFKRNKSVFQSLLRNEMTIKDSIYDNDIMYGNRGAEQRILVLSSLTCMACANLHRELVKFNEYWNGAVSITYRFNHLSFSSGEQAVRNFIKTLYLQMIRGHDDKAFLLLDDWYRNYSSNKIMTIDPPELSHEESERIDIILEELRQWSEKVSIGYTPAVFLNGSRIPFQYGIEDVVTNLSVKAF